MHFYIRSIFLLSKQRRNSQGLFKVPTLSCYNLILSTDWIFWQIPPTVYFIRCNLSHWKNRRMESQGSQLFLLRLSLLAVAQG